MRSILLAALFMMLFAELSCSPGSTGNRMVAFKPDRGSARYRGTPIPTRNVTAIVKDEVTGAPVHYAEVEIYIGNNVNEPLMTTRTSLRGRFIFSVAEGIYTIVVRHQRFRETKIPLLVEKVDVDMNEIRMSSFYD